MFLLLPEAPVFENINYFQKNKVCLKGYEINNTPLLSIFRATASAVLACDIKS